MHRLIKVVKQSYARIKHLLSVPPGNDDLLKAQFRVFASQVPLMYCIVLMNSWVLAMTFYATAPLWQKAV